MKFFTHSDQFSGGCQQPPHPPRHRWRGGGILLGCGWRGDAVISSRVVGAARYDQGATPLAGCDRGDGTVVRPAGPVPRTNPATAPGQTECVTPGYSALVDAGITSIVAVIATSSVAVWSARHTAKVARDTRTYQRLAESYLEVLRIVEREGQWIEISITNWKIRAQELAACGIDAILNNEETGFKRVKEPERPGATDRATILAHLTAFGSPKVRGCYHAWASITAAIDTELETVEFNAYVNYPPDLALSLDDLKRLEELGGQERAARNALGYAIAQDVGLQRLPRRTAVSGWWDRFRTGALFQQISSHRGDK